MTDGRLRIYFAGSIRGGREDAALYRELIAFLSEKGEVLTEHVGAADVREREKDLSDREIYERDVALIRACDVLVAECTRPSLGVGYELAYAEAAGKPCLLLYRGEEGTLSAMLSGNAAFPVYRYADADEAKRILDAAFAARDFAGSV